MAAVLSCDSASTTISSSAHATDSRHARMRSSSLSVTTTTESRTRLTRAPRPPRPARARASARPSSRRGSTACGARRRRVRSARRRSDRRGPRRACRGAAAMCSGPVSRRHDDARPAQQRQQRVEVGRAAPRSRRPSPRRSRARAPPRRAPTSPPRGRAASCTRRRASVAKCATGHRLAARPAPGFSTTSRRCGLSPAPANHSSMRVSTGALAGRWNCSRRSAMPSGASRARY